MTVRIKDLRLRTIIGVYEHERKHRQDVVINVAAEFDGARAAESDAVEDTVDYKAMKARIVDVVTGSRFRLLERLAAAVLEAVLADEKVLSASVEVDKPGALRFCESVSVTVSGGRA